MGDIFVSEKGETDNGKTRGLHNTHGGRGGPTGFSSVGRGS